ncbi:hypothetical protein BS47DRAFT_1384578 [Hydnum rufescens UP504]|uniref:HNH nuclease domain-containing protein n=1 Tax=Hydnum rufescens UP504 TaxID=1448309 RepID=A0A9P6DRY5_9AGAM|nr:hypothetical protein BS47DRAFT_1384578 [Hydnum rufescens UP504]
MLYLRVNRAFLLHLPAPTAAEPDPQPLQPDPGTTGNLNVIIADLASLRPFAGNTVDWLIKVARLIFEPLGTSSLYTFTTESLDWWLGREMEPTSWRLVLPGEQLAATIYEFRPNNDVFVALTKVSARFPRSVTTATSRNQAMPFRTTLLERHQKCIITGEEDPLSLVASHLIPRRLGDAGVQSVFGRFTDGFLELWTCLLISLRTLMVVDYEHGFGITLISHNPALELPPVGVFNWHYIQCVLAKFATADYQAVANIFHFALPFRTRDDDDDESDRDFDDERNIADPPYPSYLWELAEFRLKQFFGDVTATMGAQANVMQKGWFIRFLETDFR